MNRKSILIVLDQYDDLQSVVDQIVELFNSPENRLIFVFVKGAYQGIERSFDVELEKLYENAGISHLEEKNSKIERAKEIEAHAEIRTAHTSEISYWLRQAKYVDLLVVSSSIYGENKRDILQLTTNCVEASVLVLTEDQAHFKNIVLVYDTAYENIASIKMFCKLFPNWCSSMNVSLLLVDSEERLDQSTEKQIIRYLNHQCTNLGMHQYQGEDIKHLKSALEYKESTLLAYGTKSEEVVLKLFNEPQNEIEKHAQILMH